MLKNIILYLFSIQEKFLIKKLEKTIGATSKSKRKQFFQDGCLLTFDSIAENEKNKFEEELLSILESCSFSPKEVLNYIELNGTPVYYIDSAKALNSVCENEGFLYPQKGLKALYLTLLTQQSPKFKTAEMFILSKGDINPYYFMYHFYNWYSFKHKINGIDAESQKLLNKYLFQANTEDFSKLQLADIYRLKDIIKQDKDAIEFVFKLCQKYESSKNAFNKIKNDGARL